MIKLLKIIGKINNLFRRKSILDELNIVLVDKIGCGWYNLIDASGAIYEFQFENENARIYRKNDIVYDSKIAEEALNLYILVGKLPRMPK